MNESNIMKKDENTKVLFYCLRHHVAVVQLLRLSFGYVLQLKFKN